MLYAHVIHERQPDYIVEAGTGRGGSASFFADMLKLIGDGHVITIDVKDKCVSKRPDITYLHGSSTDRKIMNQVKDIVGDSSVMVSLDSNHTLYHVLRELRHYGSIVTKGQYLVVEDTHNRKARHAVDWFLKTRRHYKLVPLEQHFTMAVTRRGWLLNG
jgi:cephalosporin hydroxylase